MTIDPTLQFPGLFSVHDTTFDLQSFFEPERPISTWNDGGMPTSNTLRSNSAPDLQIRLTQSPLNTSRLLASGRVSAGTVAKSSNHLRPHSSIVAATNSNRYVPFSLSTPNAGHMSQAHPNEGMVLYQSPIALISLHNPPMPDR